MKFDLMPISKIKLGKNSRLSITDGDLSELMGSIKERGLLQPIGVKQNGKGYEVVYGNRRFLACSKLGMSTIPVVIREENEKEFDSDMDNLTENIQRRNISLAEAGRYMKYLNESMTKKEIAARLSISLSYINSCMEAYSEVPEDYRPHLEAKIGSNRKKRTPGKIPIATAQVIINAQKAFKLSQPHVRQLFDAAKTKDEFIPENIKKYALALKQGKSEFLKEVKAVKVISPRIVVHEDEYDRLMKKYVEDGPYKSVAALIVDMCAGLKSERIKVVRNEKGL